jgi:hypothetical protein
LLKSSCTIRGSLRKTKSAVYKKETDEVTHLQISFEDNSDDPYLNVFKALNYKATKYLKD